MTTSKPVLTRRDFVRGTVGATLGTTLFGVTSHPVRSAEPRSSAVCVIRNEKALGEGNKVDAAILKSMLDELLIQFTGQKTPKEAWLSLVKPEDTVGLVATPHLNPTHPELVDLVKAGLVEAGVPANKIMDAQGKPDRPEACTALIALPALKAHWLTGFGTVMKNYITFSGKPSSYHGENNAKLGEIWDLPAVKGKTKLVLVDALRPLCDKGPQPDPRYLWNYNGLIAGTDPVAVETIALKIVEEKRKTFPGGLGPLSPPPLCVETADKVYHLGTSNLAEIKIIPLGWDKDRLL